MASSTLYAKAAQAGIILKKGSKDIGDDLIRELQHDLRHLGYLRRGIDGIFGPETEFAVMALQHDLLRNAGKSTSNDGLAPVKLTDFNRGRVHAVTGVVDEGLAQCISEMVDNPRFPLLPCARNPQEENSLIVASIKNLLSIPVPAPYLVAMLKEVSGLKHYHEPMQGDDDTCITVSFDCRGNVPYEITSRRYGVGGYTIYHHPPKQKEVDNFMLDIGKNIRRSALELKETFDHFINGQTSDTRADDRAAEVGAAALRLCLYPADDQRYMKDCRNCLINAGRINIKKGDSVYEGSRIFFAPTSHYRRASYNAAPVRKNIPCDWPYAVRRYSGPGVDSYHYQVRVLLNILELLS